MATPSFQSNSQPNSHPEPHPPPQFSQDFTKQHPINFHLNQPQQVLGAFNKVNESNEHSFNNHNNFNVIRTPNSDFNSYNLPSNHRSTELPFNHTEDKVNAFNFLKKTTHNILEQYNVNSNPPYKDQPTVSVNNTYSYYNGFINNYQNSQWNYGGFNTQTPQEHLGHDSSCSSHSSSSGPASSDESEIESDIPDIDNSNSGSNSSFHSNFEHDKLLNGISSDPKIKLSDVSIPEIQTKRIRKQTNRYEESINLKKKQKTRVKLHHHDSYNSASSTPHSMNGIEYNDYFQKNQESSRSITSQDSGSNSYFENFTTNQHTESDSNNRSSNDNFIFHRAKGRPPRIKNVSQANTSDAFYIGRGVRAGKRTKSLRERKKILNYAEIGAEYETDDEEKAIDLERSQQENDQGFISSVDRVLNLKVNPDTGETEYLIKWKNQAHIHNTWEVYEFLKGTHGIKKVDNFTRRTIENTQRRSLMTPDEIEQEDISIELQKQLDDDATIAERVVEASIDPETNVPAYLVKWLSSPYDQCTWEVEETLIKHNFKHLIDDYYARQERTLGENALKFHWNTQSLGLTQFEPYTETPSYMSKTNDKKLRDYQLIGLNWMVSRMKRGLSVLLADEMGLGKTVQTIALIGHMVFTEHLIGPFLIIVPQSTIDNWLREFQYWLPEINAVCLHGNAMARDMLRFYELRQVTMPQKGQRWRFDVCITTPSILNSPPDIDFLRKIYWQLMVIDEAHQLKNRNSKRFQELRLFQAEYKLLLSGTPLHNNLEEMWTLLHFTNPFRYSYYEDFRRKYPDIENTAATGESKQKQLANLQTELHEVVLRRVKRDVEKSLPNKVESILQVEMSPYQEQWYENVYTRNYEQLARSSGGARNSLQNICMELKKVCNHPFLCSAPQSPAHYQSGLVQGSGKMCLLEKLLIRLKEKNHRVLVFSQMVRMLNLLSEYLTQKGFKHQRLDGSMGKEMRKKAMDHFNSKDSDDFVFLLSTKAGGLGINLTSADTVIIYDSDWNPQNDLQAEARAHRIGQTKTVQIYRLVTKNSIEQSILERAKTKMVLDTLVVQGLNKKHNSTEMMIGSTTNTSFSREDLARILRFGAQNLWKRHEVSKVTVDRPIEVDLDKILEEAQVTTQEHTGIADDLLSSFNNITEFRYIPSQEIQDNINDKDFWSNTIPVEERLKYKKLKDQELLVSGPRRTRARDLFTEKGGDDEDYVDEDVDIIPEESKKKIIKPKKKSNYISEKDRYRLYRSLLKYGTTEARLNEIHEDSRLMKFERKVIENECQAIIELCRKRLQEIGYTFNNDELESPSAPQSTNDDNKNDTENDGNGKNGNIAPHFVAIGENKANAVDLVERVELLTMLDAYIKNQNPNCSEPWKLPAGLIIHPGRIKPPPPEFENSPLILTLPEKVTKKLKEWTAKDVRNWGLVQDINLIRGTYIYGFGSWTEVYTDPNLDLEQIKDIKYDKVKMRALRTLKLLQNAINENKGKSKKRSTKTEIKEEGASTKLEDIPSSPSPSNSSPKVSLQTLNSESSQKPSNNKQKSEPQLPTPKVESEHSNILETSEVSPDISTFLRKDLSTVDTQELKHYVKILFKPMKKRLKKIKSLADKNLPQTEIINRLKRLLPIFGDLITDSIRHCEDQNSSELFNNFCWNYVANFTFVSSKDLESLYLGLCNLRDDDENFSKLSSSIPEVDTKRPDDDTFTSS